MESTSDVEFMRKSTNIDEISGAPGSVLPQTNTKCGDHQTTPTILPSNNTTLVTTALILPAPLYPTMPPALRRPSTRANQQTANNKTESDTTTTLRGRKRGRESEDAAAESDQSRAKKAKAPTSTKTRDLDPNVRRSTRSPKPAAKVKSTTPKRKRRSKAQKAADDAAAEEEKRRKEESAREARQKLARMDVDDDLDKARMATKAARRLSDISSLCDGEEFVGFNEMPASSSSDESSESEGPEDLEEAFKAIQKQMAELQQRLAASRGGKKKRSEGGKKKSANDIAYASGLLPDSRPRASKERSQNASQVNISMGGLNDEDADAANPFAGLTQEGARPKPMTKVFEAGSRDLSRQNELVILVPKGEEPVKQGTRSAKSLKSETKPATRVKAAQAEAKVKTEEKENLPIRGKADEDKSASKKRRVLNPNNVRVNDLPDFAKNTTWKKSFLPTLYDKFFASADPFSQFAKGSKEFVALLQVIMKEVYPKVQYKVSATEPIHAIAYNRINEKRSHIGTDALNIVKKHIGTIQDAKATREWLLWAARGDGPLFFRDPVAPDAPRDRDSKNYMHPGGRLLSPFLIDLIGPYLRLKSGSASANGHPRGLVALSMAALERAVYILLQAPEEIPEFSSGTWASKVNSYYNDLDKVTDDRWKTLLDMCGSGKTMAESVDEEYQANLSFMDHNRGALFDFPSPVKA